MIMGMDLCYRRMGGRYGSVEGVIHTAYGTEFFHLLSRGTQIWVDCCEQHVHSFVLSFFKFIVSAL